MIRVKGFCPMGHDEETLVVADTGGEVLCSDVDCPQPDAAARILELTDVEHIVDLETIDFWILHPLRERIGISSCKDLELCELHTYLTALDAPPASPGRYMAALCRDGDWHFDVVT